MLNVLAAERLKLKRDRLLLMSTMAAVIFPLMLLGGGANELTSLRWVFRLQMMCQLCVYPILSGFVITFLMQKEYADLTIISALTAPVSRMKFLFGKLTVWFVWHLTVAVCFTAVICLGVYTLFGASEFAEIMPTVIKMTMTTGIFSFGSLIPAAWIAVMQRKMFYPSLMFSLAATGLGFAGLLQPGLLGSAMPWSAVLLLTMPGGAVNSRIAYASIAVCAVLGLLLAALAFRKQEL